MHRDADGTASDERCRRLAHSGCGSGPSGMRNSSLKTLALVGLKGTARSWTSCPALSAARSTNNQPVVTPGAGRDTMCMADPRRCVEQTTELSLWYKV
jgi:hypothetical protein